MNDRKIIELLLDDDPAATRELESWINAAAMPYRSRLSWYWDDLLQDLRLEVLQLFRKGAFEGRSSLKSYIWSVVNHTCIDHLRRNACLKFTTLDALSEAGSPPVDPMAKIHEDEKAQGLLRILGAVPEHCRLIWRLILSGQKPREISEKLMISEGTLRVRVHRCRKQAVVLRQKLGQA